MLASKDSVSVDAAVYSSRDQVGELGYYLLITTSCVIQTCAKNCLPRYKLDGECYSATMASMSIQSWLIERFSCIHDNPTTRYSVQARVLYHLMTSVYRPANHS